MPIESEETPPIQGNGLTIIQFPFPALDRNQLEPGLSLVGMRSKEDIEAMLLNIRNAVLGGCNIGIGQIRDLTKFPLSREMFSRTDGTKRPGETFTVINAEAIIIEPRGRARQNAELHDLLSLGVGVDQDVEFPDGSHIQVDIRHELTFRITSTVNTGSHRFLARTSLEMMENPHRSSTTGQLRETRKRIAQPDDTLELRKWRRQQIRELTGRIEHLRSVGSIRDITLPEDWEKREKAIDRRNQYHIENPASGGLPSLGGNSR